MNTKDLQMKRIHTAIAEMRGMQPKILPFATCWNRLKQQRPELFNGLEAADSGPGPSSPATQEASVRLAQRDALSLAAALEVLRAYAARDVTVHASKPDSQEVVVECLSGWSIWS